MRNYNGNEWVALGVRQTSTARELHMGHGSPERIVRQRPYCAGLVALVTLLLSGSSAFAADTVYGPLVAGSASVEEPFTDTGVYRIDEACDNDTGQTPGVGWEERGVVTVYTVSLQVRRSGSGDKFKDSAAVAAGGHSPGVHKADVRVQTDPAVSGIPVTVQIRSGEGRGRLAHALLTIGSITDGSGEISGTFVSSDTRGAVTLEARNDRGVLLDTARIDQQWDDDEGLEFHVPDYFVPEQPDESTFTCRLAEKVPITGHTLNYYTYAATVRSYQWNLTTGEETQDERTYDDPIDGLPFGLDVNDLIRHSATTEVKAGAYRNTQTVHDYFDLVEENGNEYWREALVVDYEMAVEDDGVYNH